MSSPEFHVIRAGPYEIDPATGEVRGGGEPVRLQPQTVNLLLVLIERAGQVVSREELHRRLWPDTSVDFEDGLHHAIARLREALHDSAQAPRFIETVPRRGYRFIAPVESLPPTAPSPVRAPAARSPDQAPTPSLPEATPRRAASHPMWKWAVSIAGLAILALAALGGWRATVRRGIASIAALPFANLSSDPTQDFFADGVTDELVTELAKIDGLRVVSRTSTRGYKGTVKPVPEIGRDLDVDALVEGTVQRSGQLVRLTVQLIRVAPESLLWAQTYEGSVDELFPLRTRVAGDIARQVGRRLPRPVAADHEVPAAAYAAYLLGWNFARQLTREGYEKSLGYFEQAIAADPQFALAYSQLAESHAMLDYADDQRGEHLERAKALTRRALELAPDLPEARLREADLKFYWEWDWHQCDTGFRAARDLAPASPDVREHYALCLAQLGRFDEARAEFERTIELEPLSPRAHFEARL